MIIPEPFNNVWTQSSTDKVVYRYGINQMLSSSSQLLTTADSALFCCLNCAQLFHYRVLSSSQRLGGAAEHLIDVSEKQLCQLSFEF